MPRQKITDRVYVTPDGTRFHMRRKDMPEYYYCGLWYISEHYTIKLLRSKKPDRSYTEEEARKQGYRPCKNCLKAMRRKEHHHV